jgi:hypothetical protein
MSLAPSALNLLTLPRELRDRIYSYLTHTIDIQWDGFTKDAPRGMRGEKQILEPIRGHLVNCPLPSVLLVHPRIHQEYHAMCEKVLEAFFDESLCMVGPPERLWRPLEDSTIARLRHVTVNIRLHIRTTFQNLDWQNQLHLLGTLATKATQLQTLRVGVRQQYRNTTPIISDQHLDAILADATCRLGTPRPTAFLPGVPVVLNDLVLVQRGEGYRIGYLNAITNRTPTGPATLTIASDTTYMLEDFAYSLRHGVRKIGVYTYARQGLNYEKRLWTTENAISSWPMRDYPKEALDNVPTERATLWAGLPRKLTGWVEKRGAKDVKNWF